MSLSTLVLYILFEQASITTELTWITKKTSYSICHDKDQLLMWEFNERPDEKIMELQWFFNETTLICLESTVIGFHLERLYHGKIERKGKAMILLKNISLNDTGKYTLYVKLAGEKERNMQHIHLTVHEHEPCQCKPVVDNASNPFLHCSTNCSKRSQLSPEWIINGTQGPKGIGSYLKFDAVTSEQALCCLKYHDHGEDQYNFCIPNPFLSNHVTGNDRRGPNETNQVKATNFESLVIVSITVSMVFIVIGAITLAFKLKRTLRTRDVKPKISKDVSDKLNGVDNLAFSTDTALTHSFSRQNIQIVNNIRMDAEFVKSIIDSERMLLMHHEAIQQENKKLKQELQHLKHYSRQNELEASHESSEKKEVADDLHNRSYTDEWETSSVYENSLSEPFAQNDRNSSLPNKHIANNIVPV